MSLRGTKLHMSRKAKIVAKLLPIIAWMLVIFLMSSEVAGTSSARSDEIVRTIQSIGISAPEGVLTFLVRKAAHISAYFVLGILIYSLLKEYRLRVKHLVLASIALAMLYACTDELHQMFVPGRSGEARDVLIDTAGAAAGVGAYAAVARRLYKKPELV